MAIGVREAVLKQGMGIPRDIALVGFDDIEVGALSGIDLTTVSQKKFEMGALGVKILVGKIEGKTLPVANQVVLRDELIIRRSCGYQRTGYRR